MRALTLLALLLAAAVSLASAAAPPPLPTPQSSQAGYVASAVCGKDGKYFANNYPSSPYQVVPFTEAYKFPPEAQMDAEACRGTGANKHCVRAFHITVKETRLPAFKKSLPSCASKPDTMFATYNGTVPGPTIRVPTGTEAVVRMLNMIDSTLPMFPPAAPCTTEPGRSGHGFSCHHHGSASLAPFDGWADDVTCYGESKEYVYPANRPATEWYHDHAIHITSNNAYAGMAGLFIVSGKVKDGACGEPWGLENIMDYPMEIGDRVVDDQCQLYYDNSKGGPHEKSVFGDVTLVNGVPYPYIPMDLKDGNWRRFRFNNQAVSRPYVVKIKDQQQNDIHQNRCYVIAGDGGYKQRWVKMPPAGFVIGVAERYEIVCDFKGLAGSSVYFWNDQVPIQKDVAYFCWSHLIARMDFTDSSTTGYNGPHGDQFDTTTAHLLAPDMNYGYRPNFRVLNDSVISQALTMANQNRFHRNFQFGPCNGKWCINGETWDTNKIAAKDIGHNTWELWRLETGGGWFHPVHMHLVDFYVVKRVTSNPVPGSVVSSTWPGVRDQEWYTPKDVVYLGPSETIYLLVRFGAQKGDYMFHCHNLVHEDNDMLRAFSVDKDTGQGAIASQRATGLFIPNYVQNIVYGNYYYVQAESAMDVFTAAVPAGQRAKLDWKYLNQTILTDLQWYRIFYPTAEDKAAYYPLVNPWEVQKC